MIPAILKAQFLSLRPGRSGGDLRGSVFSALTAIVWYGFWGAVAASAYGYCARTPAAQLAPMLRGALFLVFVYWQVVPVVTATIGASLDMRKLAVYPISVATLFQVEVMLRAVSGIEMLLVLAGGSAGLLVGAGRGRNAVAVAAAGALFAIFNVLVASGSRSLLQRFLARGRVRDTLVLVGVCALLLPRLIGFNESGIERIGDALPLEDGLPWTLARHAMMGEYVLPSLLGLLAWSAVAALFGRWQFERSLRFDITAAQAQGERRTDSRLGAWMERFYRLPALLLRDPLAVLVEKELRTMARAPRFRMIFIMGFSFGMLVWLPLVLGRRAQAENELAHNFLTIVTLYALTLLGQVSYWNSFGFDRSAVWLYYHLPQPMARVIAGKNIASLLFIYIEAAILTALTLALRVSMRAQDLLEAAATLTIAAVYMLALGNLSSVQYPRPLSPERVSQGGASGRFQALVFLLYPVALLPVFLAYVARTITSSAAVFWALMAVAAAIGAALYWIAFESAAAAAVRRREYILRELSKGEGPVATN